MVSQSRLCIDITQTDSIYVYNLRCKQIKLKIQSAIILQLELSNSIHQTTCVHSRNVCSASRALSPFNEQTRFIKQEVGIAKGDQRSSTQPSRASARSPTASGTKAASPVQGSTEIPGNRRRAPWLGNGATVPGTGATPGSRCRVGRPRSAWSPLPRQLAGSRDPRGWLLHAATRAGDPL